MKRTTRITAETRSLTVVRPRGGARFGRCAACGAETEELTTAEAAAVSRTTEREIFRLVEAGRVHFEETREGALLICAESLAAARPRNLK